LYRVKRLPIDELNDNNIYHIRLIYTKYNEKFDPTKYKSYEINSNIPILYFQKCCYTYLVYNSIF
jgi:hypothetical protein